MKKEKVKKVFGWVVALVTLYIVTSFAWGVLHMQSCTGLSTKDSTCEEIALNNSEYCKYVLLPWKEVKYEDELSKCLDWEATQKQQ